MPSVGQLPLFCLDNLPENPIVHVTWYEAETCSKWRGRREAVPVSGSG